MDERSQPGLSRRSALYCSDGPAGEGQIVGNMWAALNYNRIDPEREFVAQVEHLMQDVVTVHCPEPLGSWDSLGS
jgi:hypothetical protein